jgi:ubiquinone/menaquinone biosynthesis C-methylase UbiE
LVGGDLARNRAAKRDAAHRARGKDVLEYGCGDGSFSLLALKLPAISASLTGIDISDVAIGKAAARPAQLGYQNARFREMNAEAMSFPDESFDVVFGRAIIHHLDLEKSLARLHAFCGRTVWRYFPSR